jgi:hypothetical protein
MGASSGVTVSVGIASSVVVETEVAVLAWEVGLLKEDDGASEVAL